MVLRKRNKHELPEVDPVEPVKQQVVVEQVPQTVGPPVPKAVVVNQANGTVGLLDQLKAYYHTAITVIGAILIALTQIATFANWVPGPVGGYITVGIAFLTGLLNFLKSNEVWVQKL